MSANSRPGSAPPRPAVAQARPIEPAAPAAAEPSSQHLTLPIAAAVLIVTAIVLGFIAIAMPPRAPGPTPVPPQAQVLYDEGVIAWTGRTAAGFATAIEKFDAALALAPDFAKAEVGLANAYNLISQYTMAPPAESYAKARAAAERAIALDPQLAEAYAALGFNAFYGSHDFVGSARLFDKSLALKPDNAQALHWYALTSMQLGKFERPLELIDHALALQPESRSIRANAALIHYYSGDTTTAIEMLEQLRQANPDYLAVPSYLATIYLDQRRYAQFLDNYEIAANVEGSVGRQLIAKAGPRRPAERRYRHAAGHARGTKAPVPGRARKRLQGRGDRGPARRQGDGAELPRNLRRAPRDHRAAGRARVPHPARRAALRRAAQSPGAADQLSRRLTPPAAPPSHR
jgi:tetratricopeptide (TPR) repeat protein